MNIRKRDKLEEEMFVAMESAGNQISWWLDEGYAVKDIVSAFKLVVIDAAGLDED